MWLGMMLVCMNNLVKGWHVDVLICKSVEERKPFEKGHETGSLDDETCIKPGYC